MHILLFSNELIAPTKICTQDSFLPPPPKRGFPLSMSFNATPNSLQTGSPLVAACQQMALPFLGLLSRQADLHPPTASSQGTALKPTHWMISFQATAEAEAEVLILENSRPPHPTHSQVTEECFRHAPEYCQGHEG